MECTEAGLGFREYARGAVVPADAQAHLDTCAACRALLARERELTAELGLVSAQTAGATASPAVRAAVLAALPSPARTRVHGTLALALAATLLLTVAVMWYVRTQRAGHPAPPPQALYTDFFPLSAVALDRHEPSHVIRIRLPRREMRRFGLPVSEELERSPVEADVLIGQDGIARAVRFVSVSH